MPYNEDMLGALSLIAALRAVKTVTSVDGFYIVEFEDTTATVVIDSTWVTMEEIEATIAEARS